MVAVSDDSADKAAGGERVAHGAERHAPELAGELVVRVATSGVAAVDRVHGPEAALHHRDMVAERVGAEIEDGDGRVAHPGGLVAGEIVAELGVA